MCNKEVDGTTVNALIQLLVDHEMEDGVTIDLPAQMTHAQAFSVVWYMQEVLHILPDKFEMCSECKIVFNSEEQGRYTDETSYKEQEFYYDSIGFDKTEVDGVGGNHFCSPECEISALKRSRSVLIEEGKHDTEQ